MVFPEFSISVNATGEQTPMLLIWSGRGTLTLPLLVQGSLNGRLLINTADWSMPVPLLALPRALGFWRPAHRLLAPCSTD